MTVTVHAIEQAARELGMRLATLGGMIAAAESCTGGLIAAALTETAGSSAWFDRGFVTYTDEAKIDLLGVRLATLAAHGAVSEPVAREMAAGALRHSRAMLSLSVTGIAGPSGATPGKPVGTVCFGWGIAMPGGIEDPVVEVATLRFDGDRTGIRRQAAWHALVQARARIDRLLVDRPPTA